MSTLEGKLTACTERPPKRYLTDDSVERFSIRGKPYDIRVRVWRGKDATPIVLASLVGGRSMPRGSSAVVANWAYSAVLGFPKCDFLYFELYRATDRSVAVINVSFEYFGCEHRMKLFNPVGLPRSWDWFHWAVGANVEP